MNLLGEGTTTSRGSTGTVPLGSRRALAGEFHGPEWNFVFESNHWIVGCIVEYQGVMDIESVKECCCLKGRACLGTSWKNDKVRYVMVWFEFFLQVCQCEWEIKRVDEKPIAPLKVKLWGVSGAAACSSTADPGADPCTGDASAPVARGSSSGDPAFGDNSAATPPGAQFFLSELKEEEWLRVEIS